MGKDKTAKDNLVVSDGDIFFDAEQEEQNLEAEYLNPEFDGTNLFFDAEEGEIAISYLVMIKRGLQECLKTIKEQGSDAYNKNLFVRGYRVINGLISTGEKFVQYVDNTLPVLEDATEVIEKVTPQVEATGDTLEKFNNAAKPWKKKAEKMAQQKEEDRIREARIKKFFADFGNKFKTLAAETKKFFRDLPANTLRLLAAPMALVMHGIKGIEDLINRQNIRTTSVPRDGSPRSPNPMEASETSINPNPELHSPPRNNTSKQNPWTQGTEVTVTKRQSAHVKKEFDEDEWYRRVAAGRLNSSRQARTPDQQEKIKARRDREEAAALNAMRGNRHDQSGRESRQNQGQVGRLGIEKRDPKVLKRIKRMLSGRSK